MRKEAIERFLDKEIVFLKRKNGYQYRAKIIDLSDEDVTITDRDGVTYVFDLDEIAEISEWKERGGK